ncbi:MAG TPA: ABC transporter permease [Actinomycetota bacterium]|nr:ABC transporter permease [Actinomycetota bacterium]
MEVAVPPEVREAGRATQILRRLQARQFTLLEIGGLVVVALVLLAVAAASIISPIDPAAQDFNSRLLPPSADHPFGTDQLGRDQLSRVLHGGRVSIVMGVLIIAIGGTMGLIAGATAGFLGGIIDEAIMRIADVFLSFPSIMLALVVAASLGPNLQNAAIAIAVAWWPFYARIVRGQVISVRDRDFVTATRTLGASEARILLRTVLPNSLGVIRLVFVLDIGFAIIAGSTLSFLGLGVSPPTPEWGLMIREAMMHSEAWWMMVFPGLAVVMLVSAINFAGGVLTRTGAEAAVR